MRTLLTKFAITLLYTCGGILFYFGLQYFGDCGVFNINPVTSENPTVRSLKVLNHKNVAVKFWSTNREMTRPGANMCKTVSASAAKDP